jgi:hypothetical protein
VLTKLRRNWYSMVLFHLFILMLILIARTVRILIWKLKYIFKLLLLNLKMNNISCNTAFAIVCCIKEFLQTSWSTLNINDIRNKQYLKIDQHLARHFVYYGECFSNPPPFLYSMKIPLFLIQWSPPIMKKGWNLANCGSPIALILPLE